MLRNIIDNRKNRYQWKRLNAVIENTSHDNGIRDADQSETPEDGGILCEDKKTISLNEAVLWAERQTYPVTLFLYNEGDGIE